MCTRSHRHAVASSSFKLRERYGEETEGGTLDLQVFQREQPRNPCIQRTPNVAQEQENGNSYLCLNANRAV